MKIISQKPNLAINNFTPKSIAYESIPYMNAKSFSPNLQIKISPFVQIAINFLLKEDSDLLLQENGDYIIIDLASVGGLSPSGRIK